MHRVVLLVILQLSALIVFVLADSAPAQLNIPAKTLTDLYEVKVQSQTDADMLSRTGVNPVLKVGDGYLVLAGPRACDLLAGCGLEYTLVATGIDRSHLAMDIRHDLTDIGGYPLIYNKEGYRIYRVDPSDLTEKAEFGLAPIRSENLRIFYQDPQETAKHLQAPDLGISLDSLVGLVSYDSILAYSLQMQSWGGRLAGSSGYSKAVAWCTMKLTEWGYDSVVVQNFTATLRGGRVVSGRNVLACKTGTTYSRDHIVIGAHLDGVASCPAADDNGSGSVAVMEMARVLRNIDTRLSIVFALFDAEEGGLCGSWYYADQAAAEGKRIALMLNMDMIAFRQNTNKAAIYHGDDTSLAQIWIDVAGSVPGINITGYLSGGSGGSDHVGFLQNGYNAFFVAEYIFSNVYHSSRDSTTYMSFDYFTRMVKACAATAYYIDASYVPSPALIVSCPDGFPAILYPRTEETLLVAVEEYAGAILLPGSLVMNYSINGGERTAVPMIDRGGGQYAFVFPPLSCRDRIACYVSAAEQVTGKLIRYPESPVKAVMATAVQVAFEDDFNDDKGWSVGGTATSGFWERVRAGNNAAEPRNDYDGSGKCYVTNKYTFADVDGGTTSLISPAIDVSKGEATIEYARWLTTDEPGIDDFSVYLDNGDVVALVESATEAQSSGGWYAGKFWVSEFITADSTIRMRLDASDLGYDSEVEAGADAVKVTLYLAAPNILTMTLPETTTDASYAQQLEAFGCYEPLTWIDKNGDLTGSGLSLAPDGYLTGQPLDTGVITFTAQVADAGGVTNEKVYSIRVWVPYVCGDANRDGGVNVGDAVYLIRYIFRGGPAPYPLDIGDATGDGLVNVGDAVYMVNYIFKGGDVPHCQ
jgi:Peptidase family M28/Dockerin type I domain